MNRIFIKGRLTRDPVFSHTNSGVARCAIGVAVDRGFGEEKQTDFFDCIFWRKDAKFVSKFFAKGKEILVEGEMQSRRFTDKAGNNRIAWEIGNARAEFCGAKDGGKPSDHDPAPAREVVPGISDGFAEIDTPDGDLPF